MNKLTYGIAISAVVLGVGGYLGINSFAQSETVAESQAAADAAPIIVESEQIIVDAVVVPMREADLSVATNGIVKTVFVEEGDYVEAGQPLLQLNDERLQAALSQVKANLANAEANLADLMAPPRSEEVAKYQANITSAQASLQNILDGASNASITAQEANVSNAEAELRIAQSDYDEEKWRSDIAMRDEALALEKATNSYNAAKAELDDLLAEADRADVASANASIVAAQSDLDLLLAGAEREQIEAAQATVVANQASVRDAQAALEEATLVAPFSGIVAAVNIEVGEQVSGGSQVVQLADTTEWWIETEDLTELDVVNVARGDSVEVSFDALGDVALSGVVKNIKPLGENNQGDITYTVLVELNEEDERLRWKMSAEANITVDEAGRSAAIAQSSAHSHNARIAGTVKTVRDIMHVDKEILPTAAITYATATVDVNGAVLNVRQGPDTSFVVIDILDDTRTVDIVKANSDGTWMQVMLNNRETGWVSADYLQLDASNKSLASTRVQKGL